MAQLVNIRLSRADATPWGFRLQGGKDFGQPLLIQKVNGGSTAERAGLQVGDALLRVNGADVQDLRHKEAQDTIVRAGHNIEMSIQRGGVATWKPQVSPVGSMPAPGGQSPIPVTKTSLAAKPTNAAVPSGHNVSPRPFGGASTPQLNGGGDVKALVNKQYNSPIGVYSEQTIAETLSAQTEVLATGALGVNFMKNEKTYDSTKSEVLKMVQEVEKEPREPEPETIAPNVPTTAFPSVTGLRHVAPPEAQPVSSQTPSNPLPPGQNICADCERLIVHAVGGRATSPRPLTPIARQMGAPQSMGAPSTPELPQDKPYIPSPSPMPGSPVCSECGKHIVGVFVRIKDKNLHVECFKCATCGSSLKNVGYYTINNKLYCDIHAKMVARQNPPAPNLDPITIAPGARIPSGAISSPTPAPFPSSLPSQPPKVARLPSTGPPSQPVSLPVSFPPSLPTAAPQSPQPGTLAPLPFHTPSAPAPKPFGSVTAPAPAPPATIPFTPSAPQSNFGAPPSIFGTPQSNFSASKPQTDNLNPVIWPPNQKKVSASESETTSCSKTKEKFETMARKKMSICSQEVCNISESCNKEICRLTGEQYDNRPGSPLPDRELGMIVKQNVVAAAQSQSERKSKRSVSQAMRQMTYTEGVCAQSLATQLMMMTPRGLSPLRSGSPEILDISSRPHQIKSLLPPACTVRALSPTQVVVFPPNLPEVMASRSRSPSPLPPTGKTKLKKKEQKTEDKIKGTPPFFIDLPVVTPKPGATIECKVEELENKRPPPSTQLPIVTVTEHSVDTNESNLDSQEKCQTESSTETSPQISHNYEQEEVCTRTEQQVKAFESHSKTEVTHTTIPEKPLDDKMYSKQEVEKIVKEELKKVFLKEEAAPKKEEVPGPSTYDLPQPVYPSGGMAMALSTASDRPFTPAPFPRIPAMSLNPNEPKPKPRKVLEKYVTVPEPSEPYFPPPPPPPDAENKDERIARALREVGCRSPMSEALTIAPRRAYSPLPTTARFNETKLSSIRTTATSELTANPTTRYKSTSTSSSETSCTKSVKPPMTLPGTASAFKPTGSGNGSLIPKSTPLVYIPHVGQDEHRMEERHGIDRQAAARGGKTKEIAAGFESSQSAPETEISEMKLSAMKSTEVQYGYAVARNPPPKTTSTSTQKSAPSGLRGDHLLPSYQQWLGDIPVRNAQVRSMSPLPHPIRAPSMEPRPMPQAPSFPHHPRTQAYYSDLQSHETQKYSSCASQAISTMSANAKQQTKQASTFHHALAPVNQQELQTCSRNQTASSSQTQSSSSRTVNQSATVSSKSSKQMSRSTRTVSPLAGRSACITSSGRQAFKPDIPARALSPSWKVDYVRSVQNLSPITVRLPSPLPQPLKPKGEQTQTTSANVMVKNKSKTTATHGQQPTLTTQTTKTQTTIGHCGTSKGCGTPPGSPERKCSPSKHCGTTQGCGTPVECRSLTDDLGRVEYSTQNTNMACCTKISNKENFLSSMMSRSESKAESPTNLSYKCTNPSEKMKSMHDVRNAVFTNKLVGILKESIPETDTKSQNLSNLNGQPRQSLPSSITSNISWQPFPTNLPLPRNCGVNPSLSGPNAGGAGGIGGGKSSIAGSTAPRRGRGVLNAAVPAGGRVPLCGHCNNQIRGPFITALGKIWCPEHFICVNPKCKRPLQDIGFVEEDDGLYCEYCFEQYLAPACDKCRSKIKGDCLNAIGKHFHPECFKCSYCEKLFGNNPFFLEDGLPYCENDWNELFTTKCFSCGFPIEAGDRWVEALNNNYHSQCFNCSMCKKNLEGQSFFAKGGRPFCKNHAR